jgi:Mn-containing catalase
LLFLYVRFPPRFTEETALLEVLETHGVLMQTGAGELGHLDAVGTLLVRLDAGL